MDCSISRLPVLHHLLELAQILVHCAVQETWVLSLCQEDPLEKGMATHSSILAWEILWTEEPGRLQSMGLQRIGHDWVTKHIAHHHLPSHPLRPGSCLQRKPLWSHSQRTGKAFSSLLVSGKWCVYSLPGLFTFILNHRKNNNSKNLSVLWLAKQMGIFFEVIFSRSVT